MRRCSVGAWLAVIFAVLFAHNALAALTIKTQPKSTTSNAGSTATFAVVTTNGTPTTYQWQFKGTNLTDNANISGSTTATLTLENLQMNQAGAYRVIINGTLISSAATLTVLQGTLVGYHVDGAGDMVVELFDHDKPVTVQNFLHYVTRGAYTDMFFHRLEPGFVLQGGDWFSGNVNGPSTTERTSNTLDVYDVFGYWVLGFLGAPPFPFWIDNEFSKGPHVRNTFGTVAMAKGSDPDSAVCEFFFNLADNSTNKIVGTNIVESLETQSGGFTVFGRVVAGTNVLDFFNTLSTNNGTIVNLAEDTGVFSELPVRSTNRPADIIIDNPQATVTGTWSTETAATDKYAADFLSHAGGAAGEYVEFTPNLPEGGIWSVFEWHAADTNRTTEAQVLVNFHGITSTNIVNQQENGGRWNFIGTYIFDSGTSNSVRITAAHTNTSQTVVADAIKFTKSPTNGDFFYADISLLSRPVIDQAKPTVTITYPLANAMLTNGNITIRGKATDNIGVSRVVITYLYSISDNVLYYVGQNASGTTNWSITPPPLNPGNYYLRVTVQDGHGLDSVVEEQFSVLGPFHLIVNGPGTTTPMTNGSLLKIGNLYQITAKPKPGQLFVNWSDGSHYINLQTVGFYMYNDFVLTANFISNNFPNSLTITYPKANAMLTNMDLTLTGKASTNLSAATISCTQIVSDQTRFVVASNLVASRSGTGGTNWSIPVHLAPGGYIAIIEARTDDGRTTMAQQHFTVLGQLRVLIDGMGKVIPNLNGQFLQVGKVYTMTATPLDRGHLFATWTGDGTTSTTPVKQFTMAADLMFTASFVSNYFPSLAGVYNGIFSPATNVTAGNAGLVNLTHAASGAFSGKLMLEGTPLPFAGKFDYAGNAQVSINRRGTNPVTVFLSLELTNAAGVIHGSVSNVSWNADLLAKRAVKTLTTNSIPAPGKFVLTIPGDPSSTNSPATNSTATLTVAASGNIALLGKMADATSFSQTVLVANDSSWPLYGSFYRGKGLLLGWQNFLTHSNGTGMVKWIKPAATNGLFTNGFSLDLETTIAPAP